MKQFFYMFIWYIFTVCKIFNLILHHFLPTKNKLLIYIKLKLENFIFFSPRVYKVKYIKKEIKQSAEKVRLFTKDMVKIHAEYLPPQDKNFVVVFFHGQSENITKWQETYLFLKKLGYGILFLSYRGHYRSAGRPSEKGIYIDAETAVEFLISKGFSAEQIILWGRSLGSAPAIHTALKYNVRAVILESPIENIKQAAISIFNRYIKIFKFIILRKLIIWLLTNAKFLQNFNNDKKIGKVEAPILILHSKNDEKISYTQSERLANNTDKAKLVLVENGSHNKSDWCYPYIEDFLNEVTK